MSRADDPYDNAFSESLWIGLPKQSPEGGVFLNVEDAKTKLFDNIEVYYNRVRKHCAGSPVVAGLPEP
ncbi:transposase [Spirosoma endbachense]|uniref:Transposase n=1 Tax=Spirosoma endbachense TaxID=2666025 RepID=A0A6P1W7V8_9BACT|nr:transposase [Spirosoma endbachense]QHW00463.1 hypothetical protein GJR95_37975 [Spirosoma endbachense]